MTEDQKKRIERLRRNGNSFNRIAEITGLGVSTIKMHCTRNGIEPRTSEEFVCIECGKEVEGKRTGRPALFCSPSCRLNHWRKNPLNNSGPDKICASCGAAFKSYVPTRKYCSHACYINDRFGEKSYGA